MKFIFLLSCMVPLYGMHADTATLIYSDNDNGYKQDAIYDLKAVYYKDDQQQLISAYIHIIGQDYVIFDRAGQTIVYQIIYDKTSGIADAQIKRLYGQAAADVLTMNKNDQVNFEHAGQLSDHKEIGRSGASMLEKNKLSFLPRADLLPCAKRHTTYIADKNRTSNIVESYLKNCVQSIYAPVCFCASIAIGIAAYWIHMRSTLIDLHNHYASSMRWSTWKDEQQIACLVRHNIFESVFHDAIMQRYHSNDIGENIRQCLEDIDAEIATCNAHLSELQTMQSSFISGLLGIHNFIEKTHAYINRLLLLKNYLVLHESVTDSCSYASEENI